MSFEEKKDTPPSIKAIGFYNGKNWITPDIDGHKGGVWKMFDKSGYERLGTFSEDLKKKLGD